MLKTNRQKAENYVSKLSPFKKQIGEAILNGLAPEEAAKQLAKRNKMPLVTYKAYATMVAEGIDKVTGGHLKSIGAGKRAQLTKLKEDLKEIQEKIKRYNYLQ